MISSMILMYFCVTQVKVFKCLKVPHFVVHVSQKAGKHIVTKNVILVNADPLKENFALPIMQ